MSARSRLSEAEVAQFIASHPGWHTEQGELRRTYSFDSFKESLRFLNQVAELAERESHHPDICLNFKRVKIALLTYDLDGVSRKDTEVAVMIDAVKDAFDKPSV